MAFCPPYWISDLLPVICIVFEQPIKTASRTDLSRVVRFVKPCAVRIEDSRYEIVCLLEKLSNLRMRNFLTVHEEARN